MEKTASAKKMNTSGVKRVITKQAFSSVPPQYPTPRRAQVAHRDVNSPRLLRIIDTYNHIKFRRKLFAPYARKESIRKKTPRNKSTLRLSKAEQKIQQQTDNSLNIDNLKQLPAQAKINSTFEKNEYEIKEPLVSLNAEGDSIPIYKVRKKKNNQKLQGILNRIFETRQSYIDNLEEMEKRNQLLQNEGLLRKPSYSIGSKEDLNLKLSQNESKIKMHPPNVEEYLQKISETRKELNRSHSGKTSPFKKNNTLEKRSSKEIKGFNTYSNYYKKKFEFRSSTSSKAQQRFPKTGIQIFTNQNLPHNNKNTQISNTSNTANIIEKNQDRRTKVITIKKIDELKDSNENDENDEIEKMKEISDLELGFTPTIRRHTPVMRSIPKGRRAQTASENCSNSSHCTKQANLSLLPHPPLRIQNKYENNTNSNSNPHGQKAAHLTRFERKSNNRYEDSPHSYELPHTANPRSCTHHGNVKDSRENREREHWRMKQKERAVFRYSQHQSPHHFDKYSHKAQLIMNGIIFILLMF